MFVHFSGFITLKNLDFKTNVLIIYFFIFFPFWSEKDCSRENLSKY